MNLELRTERLMLTEADESAAEDEAVRMEAGQLFKVWIYKQDDPLRIIGSVSLNNIVRGTFQSCHLGYRIDCGERNKGCMTEAVKAVVNHTFDVLGLHRIEANIMPRNIVSRRVAEKSGFYEEGLAIKYLKINGIWEDHIHMVMRNKELE